MDLTKALVLRDYLNKGRTYSTDNNWRYAMPRAILQSMLEVAQEDPKVLQRILKDCLAARGPDRRAK